MEKNIKVLQTVLGGKHNVLCLYFHIYSAIECYHTTDGR